MALGAAEDVQDTLNAGGNRIEIIDPRRKRQSGSINTESAMPPLVRVCSYGLGNWHLASNAS